MVSWAGSVQIEVDRVQWGVGNGGFHTEDVWECGAASSTPPMLRVVYDCGSKRRASVIDREIQAWSAASGDGESIPARVSVLVISHFDSDHVNGLLLLDAAGFKPDHVILPYLDNAERVLQLVVNVGAAGSTGPGAPDGDDARSDDDEVHADREAGHLAADPEGFINGLWPEAVATTVGGPDDGDTGPDPEPVSIGDSLSIRVRRQSGIQVSLASSSENVIWEYAWREHRPPPGDKETLPSRLQHELAKRLGIPPQDVASPVTLWDAINSKDAWKDVAAVYKSELATEDLNPYSVVLWSGPGGADCQIVRSRSLALRYLWPHRDAPVPPWWLSGGWLGTGDAKIYAESDVDLLISRLGAQVANVDVVNAPHHGSRYDSAAELYGRVPSRAGVVLTPADGRGPYRHPHAEMVRAALTAGHAVVRVGDSPGQRFMWSLVVRA